MSKGVAIGLKDFHYAVMTDEETETYDEPVRVAGAVQVTVTPTTNSTTFYSDDQADEVATSLGDIAIAMNPKDLPNSVLADLLGHGIDENGVLVRNSGDNAPYVALGYRRLLSNGKHRYIWNYKGKFRPETQEAETKGETPTFQTPTINATFVPRETDGKWQAVANEGDSTIPQAVFDNWFEEVYDGTPVV